MQKKNVCGDEKMLVKAGTTETAKFSLYKLREVREEHFHLSVRLHL